MINIADLLLENNTASERPNNDNPIVDYSDNHEKIDNDTKVEDDEPLDESGFVVSDDIYCFNFNKLDSGKTNILLVTGLSGSGKSTYASLLSKIYEERFKKKYIHFELDCLDFYLGGKIPIENIKKSEPGLYDFINKKKLSPEKRKYNNTEIVKLYKEYIKYLISWCKKHKENCYIIEGIQIYETFEMGDTHIISQPLIILGTSALKSAIQGAIRNSDKKPISFFKNFKDLIIWGFKDEKMIKKLRNTMYNPEEKNVETMDIVSKKNGENRHFEKVKIKENTNNIHESANETELYPVYIVTSYTDTKFGKIIRKASDCYYTHAAISFESDLHEMYSFGNSGTLSNSKLGGMTCESLNDYINTSKNAVILVSVVFVKEKDYKKLLAFFDEYLNNSRNTRYSYSNLFNVLKNKPISNTPSLSYICSQFVDSLFKFISIDMTDKPSNLVTPEDIANLHNVKPTVYKLFEGKAIDYNVNRIEKILDKMYSKAKPIKEATLLEAKEFPIQFNDEGDLLISKKEKIDFLAEYNKSKKLRQSYVKYKNLEGLKYECCKMWYINTILMKLLDDKNLSYSDREDYNNYRSKILTEFSQYLKEIQKIDKSFNFGSFYETTPFSNTKIKINGSTIKYTTKLMKFIFK